MSLTSEGWKGAPSGPLPWPFQGPAQMQGWEPGSRSPMPPSVPSWALALLSIARLPASILLYRDWGLVSPSPWGPTSRSPKQGCWWPGGGSG